MAIFNDHTYQSFAKSAWSCMESATSPQPLRCRAGVRIRATALKSLSISAEDGRVAENSEGNLRQSWILTGLLIPEMHNTHLVLHVLFERWWVHVGQVRVHSSSRPSCSFGMNFIALPMSNPSASSSGGVNVTSQTGLEGCGPFILPMRFPNFVSPRCLYVLQWSKFYTNFKFFQASMKDCSRNSHVVYLFISQNLDWHSKETLRIKFGVGNVGLLITPFDLCFR